MPRTTKSKTNTSTEKTVDERREVYEKVKASVKQMRDPTKSSSSTISAYDRERIRSYLKNPASYETQLREAVTYYYYRSQVLNRLVHWYAGMWALYCRRVTPDFNLVKDNKPDKMLKAYQNTIKVLDAYHIQNNWYEVAVNCYLYDVFYGVFYRDDTSAFFYKLEPDECKITGRYMTGDFSYAVDAQKWTSQTRREIAEMLGSPFIDIVKEYDRTNQRWIQMPDKYAACFKFRADDINHIIPPFAPLLQSLAGLTDTEDIQSVLDEQSIFKLISVPIPTLSGAKSMNEWAIDPKFMAEYYDALAERLPDYAPAALVPGGLTKENVIDFSNTADKDVDRLAQSQDTLFSISGGGAVLNSSRINSTAAFNAWLKEESQYATSALIGQVEGFVNRMLSYDVTGTPCNVHYFEVSEYTKKELINSLLQSCQYSFYNRLAYNACLGISELDTLAMEYFESDVLDLPGKMIHPLVSSYTSTGDEGGRPTTDEPEPSTERSRNA